MRDVDDRHTAFFQSSNGGEELFDLLLTESRGRLVHDENSGFERERLRDFNHLLFGDTEAFDPRAWIDCQAQTLQEFARGTNEGSLIDNGSKLGWLAA